MVGVSVTQWLVSVLPKWLVSVLPNGWCQCYPMVGVSVNQLVGDCMLLPRVLRQSVMWMLRCANVGAVCCIVAAGAKHEPWNGRDKEFCSVFQK